MWMKELTEFEQNVCDVYAIHHSFELHEIEWSFKRLRSFDKVLLALQMVSMFNISLMEATKFFNL